MKNMGMGIGNTTGEVALSVYPLWICATLQFVITSWWRIPSGTHGGGGLRECLLHNLCGFLVYSLRSFSIAPGQSCCWWAKEFFENRELETCVFLLWLVGGFCSSDHLYWFITASCVENLAVLFFFSTFRAQFYFCCFKITQYIYSFSFEFLILSWPIPPRIFWRTCSCFRISYCYFTTLQFLYNLVMHVCWSHRLCEWGFGGRPLKCQWFVCCN